MVFDIRKLERQFTLQKSRLLKSLEKIEKKKRSQFFAILKELGKYKRRESVLKSAERLTSVHLRQVSRKIKSLRIQDIYDRRKISALMNELGRLKKEIPKLELSIKVMKPAKSITQKHERLLSTQLKGISAKIKSVEAKRIGIQRELDSLLKKEIMLRQGRIYWTNIQKLQKKAVSKGRKSVAAAKKSGILKKLFTWK